MSQSPLTQEQEVAIYREFNSSEDVTKAELGRKYGVSPRTIGRVLDRVGGIAQPLEEEDDYEQEVADESTYTGIVTNGSISVTKMGEGVHDAITIHKGDVRFDDAWNIIMKYGPEDHAFREVYENSASIKQKIESFSFGNLQVDTDREKIMFVYSDTIQIEIPDGLEARIFGMLNEGDSGQDRLLNFANKLMENPSHRAVKELYGFLEHNDIEINDDGTFTAWKKVRGNFFDIHSGTIDNSPGKRPRVPRNMVDEDPNQTCSYGLHVCAKSYLGSFGNGGGSRVVRVVVDPADVVAVPKDYRNAKMRCCGYEVIEAV